MYIDKVTFSEVKSILKRSFRVDLTLQDMDSILDIDFLATSLEKKVGRKLVWDYISFWYVLEYYGIDPLEEDIVKQFYPISYLKHEYMIIITYESYKLDEAFGIKNKEVFDIFRKDYDKYTGFNVDFFQADDYIVLYPNAEVIVLIHHEGYSTVLDLKQSTYS